MKVNIYDEDGSLQMQGVELDAILEATDPELEIARAELEATGVYRSGGGTTPIFELRRVAESTPFVVVA